MPDDIQNKTEESLGQIVDPGAIAEAGLLGRVIDRLGLVFAIGLLIAMLILINEVVLRYVFNAPTIWAHETTIFICGMIFIYGGLYCVARDQHIRVVLIYDAVSPMWRRRFNVAISIVSATASAIFAWAAWLMVQRAAFAPDGSLRIERSGSAWDPMYPGLTKIGLFLILTVMSVQFLLLAINYFKGKD
ncbi:TRAP transporter small permease (plasmid) [Phaeobacter inhibens]|uniref:TRAP transporter small permease subunit n=1 Tax=Phaeobacter inhibens TaxID=221822 RepID=UPI0021A95AC8|nr:TRAP transporter small permease [Phaeobacter inhibens]UWS05984.1 TRAP transporter small permease [Phaeobacter inhibens]